MCWSIKVAFSVLDGSQQEDSRSARWVRSHAKNFRVEIHKPEPIKIKLWDIRTSSMINNPRVVLLRTDPPAVAAGPDFGRHRQLKKGKARSRGETIIRGGHETRLAEVIPRNPALWIGGRPVSSRTECLICKNMNVKPGWQQAKIGGYQDLWGRRGARPSWKWIPLGRSPRFKQAGSSAHLRSGKWGWHKHILDSIR